VSIQFIRKHIILIGILSLNLAHFSLAEGQNKGGYSPELNNDYATDVYWGDTHVHSAFSMDANIVGNTRLGPAAAYRFAMGEAVVASNGMKAKLNRRLDFLVVSDHAEYMGILPALRAKDPEILATEFGSRLYRALTNPEENSSDIVYQFIRSLAINKPLIKSKKAQRRIWTDSIAAAEASNQPGKFTALIGYEWSAMPAGDNLHRVVIFADGADKVAQIIPKSAFDGEDPEDLWQFLQEYENTTGGRVLAIPHNSNLSNGRMFAVETSEGLRINGTYAEQRARWEPLVEVTQIKGDSEAHPLLSPDDEFADFGTWDKGNIEASGTIPKTADMLPGEYVRSALQRGLELEREVGVNPFKLGMIGSSDEHTSFAAVEENNYWGKVPKFEPSKSRAQGIFLRSSGAEKYNIMAWQQVASGYAGVWARENTRQSIFDAMLRREVYASTGPRITVRFFGGWSFSEADLYEHNIAEIGYQKGVPMGGDLRVSDDTEKPPSFIVLAIKDADGANLDRIQIVKGWVDNEGNSGERVFDVALSDGRSTGVPRVPALVSTVDVLNASYSNTIGAVQLAVVWEDPDFNTNDHAFYYARVIEIPTPRWTAFDAKILDAEIPAEAEMEVQERVYTSPIWYTPSL
jgi:plasmid maintenance system killer protein